MLHARRASSFFTGEKLLTTPNPGEDRDQTLLEKLGLETTAISWKRFRGVSSAQTTRSFSTAKVAKYAKKTKQVLS